MIALLGLAMAFFVACGGPASAPAPSASAAAAGSPTAVADPQTLQCGIFNGSDHVSASATTPAVYLLALTETSVLRFTWNVGLRDMPAVGEYMCARFRQSATTTIFVSIVGPGDPGYVARP
jgi:hypothetical protein